MDQIRRHDKEFHCVMSSTEGNDSNALDDHSRNCCKCKFKQNESNHKNLIKMACFEDMGYVSFRIIP